MDVSYLKSGHLAILDILAATQIYNLQVEVAVTMLVYK